MLYNLQIFADADGQFPRFHRERRSLLLSYFTIVKSHLAWRARDQDRARHGYNGLHITTTCCLLQMWVYSAQTPSHPRALGIVETLRLSILVMLPKACGKGPFLPKPTFSCQLNNRNCLRDWINLTKQSSTECSLKPTELWNLQESWSIPCRRPLCTSWPVAQNLVSFGVLGHVCNLPIPHPTPKRNLGWSNPPGEPSSRISSCWVHCCSLACCTLRTCATKRTLRFPKYSKIRCQFSSTISYHIYHVLPVTLALCSRTIFQQDQTSAMITRGKTCVST